jgi:glycosyltransferase involved in cell wall biosynthesis
MTETKSTDPGEITRAAELAAADVTILLSTFNGGAFLAQQLNSLFVQEQVSISVLVRDDGSSDSTNDILKQAHSIGQIELLASNASIGATSSFLELLKSAATTATKYVAFCDQDDLWRPDKISRAVASLSAVPAAVPAMYCSRLEIVGTDLTTIGFTALPRRVGFGNALVENVCVGCTMVLNRAAVELLCQNLPGKVLAHDWWCYLVLSCFGEIVFDGDAPIKYRQHGGNVFGAPRSGLERLTRSLRRFFGHGDGRNWQSAQAAVFRATFDDRIPVSQRRVLDHFVEAKLNWRSRIRLALSRDIWRQKRVDNLVWRMLILMNRY